jgi:hypothetical protein
MTCMVEKLITQISHALPDVFCCVSLTMHHIKYKQCLEHLYKMEAEIRTGSGVSVSKRTGGQEVWKSNTVLVQQCTVL